MNRRIISVISVLISVLIAWGLISYFTSFQDLTVVFPDNLSRPIKLYQVPKGVDSHSIQSSNDTSLIKELNSTQTFRVKKGSYVILADENNEYGSFESYITVGDKPTITTVEFEFSDKKLQSILDNEEGQIHSSIKSQVPRLKDGFKIDQGRLFTNGDWYATTIRKNLSEEEARLNYVDVFRIVTHKENGNWIVVTNPPALVISSSLYKEIPPNILRYVNDLN